MGDFKSSNRGGFNRGGNRSGGSRFGGRSSGGSGGFNRGGGRSFGGGQGRPQMHDATCSECGKPCQVPFKPTGSKPVLCSDCFRQSDGQNSGGNFASRNPDRAPQISSSTSSGISQEQFKQLNTKLDKILLVLQDLELTGEDDEDEEAEEEESEAEE